MPEKIYPLNVDVAAELRDELTALDAGTEWRVTRLCEQAQAAGYQAGYIRGRVDGRHRESIEHTCPANTDRTIGTQHLVEAEIAIARLTKDSAGRPVQHSTSDVAHAVADAFELELHDEPPAETTP